jgi:hypothetical protein
MQALKRFLSGGLVAAALVVVGSAATPADLAAQDVCLVCTEIACCTVVCETGKIIDCHWRDQ